MSSPNRAVILLPSTTITTAAANVVPAASVITGLAGMTYAAVQAKFTYGSGGTSAKFYVQTTLDGGATWFDVMCFAFATTTATKASAVKTSIATAAAVTPGSAALTDNTILDGILGDQLRLLYTTVGTYAGGTTIAIAGVLKGTFR